MLSPPCLPALWGGLNAVASVHQILASTGTGQDQKNYMTYAKRCIKCMQPTKKRLSGIKACLFILHTRCTLINLTHDIHANDRDQD